MDCQERIRVRNSPSKKCTPYQALSLKSLGVTYLQLPGRFISFFDRWKIFLSGWPFPNSTTDSSSIARQFFLPLVLLISSQRQNDIYGVVSFTVAYWHSGNPRGDRRNTRSHMTHFNVHWRLWRIIEFSILPSRHLWMKRHCLSLIHAVGWRHEGHLLTSWNSSWHLRNLCYIA